MARSPVKHVLYKNGVEVAVGTVKQIAEQVGLSAAQLYRYKDLKNKNMNRERLVSVNLEDGDWALYQGEELLMIGTLEEIAESRGVKASTIRFYSYPSYLNRGKRNRANYYLEVLK